MHILRNTSAMVVFSALTVAAHADFTPYANVGTVAPTTLLYAAQTGNLVGTFLNSGAGGEDRIRLFDVTKGTYSPYVFDNRTTSPGQTGSFGLVTAGDQLAFEVTNSDVTAREGAGFVMSSVPSLSTDLVNHFYVTTSGGVAYLSAEDNSVLAGGTDYNYQDVNFSVSASQLTAVSANPVPEPSSLMLLGTGLMGAIGVLKRRFVA